MPKPIYLCADNILSSLGLSTQENMDALYNQYSGIKCYNQLPFSQVPMCTSLINRQKIQEHFAALKTKEKYTHLEKMLLVSVQDALSQTSISANKADTLFVFSTTKGNINLLEESHDFEKERIFLWRTAEIISQHFNNTNTPITISNACISGVTAINTAASLLRAGQYKHAVIMGADIMSEFTPSGFQSFKAISSKPCKPFDQERDGITLGEAAGTIILSTETHTLANKGTMAYLGGASSNDANHISGPSRTGDGLYLAIKQALTQSGKTTNDIHLLSAHGTATVYNDEMESKAFDWAGLNQVPVNSLKGYWGHTLGAAGIIESIATCHSLLDNKTIATLGYSKHGVPKPLNIITKTAEQTMQCALKTASGFGGSNAAAVFQKL